MDITNFKNFDNHEFVILINDKKSGLKAVLAIHNTVLGPATGGTRYRHYASTEAAIEDALRLSRTMTYKCAMAKVPFGGGKGVIIAGDKNKKSAMLKAYSQRLNFFGGNFTTGEDIGIEKKDLKILQKFSPYVNGKKAGELGPWAALGIFSAMTAACKIIYHQDNLKDKTVAIKGLGKVGSNLCALALRSGARIIAADIDPISIKRAKKTFPQIEIVAPELIHKIQTDIFSPCAINGDLNITTIPELKCKIVCGGANNQLASPECGEMLQKKGIIYVPDFIANAGGLINVVGELNFKTYNAKWVEEKTRSIYKTTQTIINLSQKQHLPEETVAINLANKILSK